jgi:hypothetical protein
MYTLLNRLNLSYLFKNEALPFGISFVLAEMFYKFQSFGFECIAFLITWYLLGKVQSVFKKNAIQ